MDDTASPPTGKSGRQQQIVADLQLYPAMRVNELAERLGVSTETIRRDLSDLDGRGLISRTYGGAMRTVTHEPGLSEREALMISERLRIAAAAAQFVRPNDILMIGGGATTLHFARRIAALDMPMTVITHSFSIAVALAASSLIKVLMLPGQYDGREGLIHGADTVEQLQRFRANKAFLGASGLTVEGPNDAAMGPGLIYGMMMRRSSASFVLADHGKFDQPSLTVYGPWSPSITLISNAKPDGELLDALHEAQTELVVA